MLKVGQIVEAKVARVEPYGLFLLYKGDELFVHLPELSLGGQNSLPSRDLLDSLLRVKVLRKHPEKNQWIASTRALA